MNNYGTTEKTSYEETSRRTMSNVVHHTTTCLRNDKRNDSWREREGGMENEDGEGDRYDPLMRRAKVAKEAEGQFLLINRTTPKQASCWRSEGA